MLDQLISGTLLVFTSAGEARHPILLFQQGLDDPRFNSWQEKRDFSLLQNVQISSGTHQAYYSIGTESSSPRGKLVHVKLTTNLHLVPRAT
jgi:hypothetical protein